MASDAKLWRIFSEYIRLRDSDEKGYGKCITCGKVCFYKEADCGHGVGRQYKATKFDERNNHLQCRKCNFYGAGEQAIYKQKVEEKYGEGTWAELVIKSRSLCKRGKLDIDVMADYYKKEVKKLKEQKKL